MKINQIVTQLLLLIVASNTAVSQSDTTEKSVQVVIDPRIELIGVVQLLNDYMLTTKYDFIYKNDVRKYFSPFQNHLAVKIFGEMSKSNFNFDAVPKAIIALDDPPGLKNRTNFTKYVIDRAGGEAQLKGFVEALRSFAANSQFMSFFRAHSGTYEIVLDSTRTAAENAINVLRDYSRMDIQGTVILGMLFHDGGFATLEEETSKAYAIIGPVDVQGGLPTFGSEVRIARWVTHEFSHTIVNPLTQQYIDEINKYAELYDTIADQMRRQAYPNWHVAVNEHIVRAITTRLAYLEGGTKVGQHALEQEEGKGFKYVAALVERLKEYEEAHDKYSSFQEFYPRLIEVFYEILETK